MGKNSFVFVHSLSHCVSYRLGKMEITVQEIPKEFQEDLENAIIKIEKMKYNSQDISNIIYSLSKMKYLWKDLTPQTTESLNRMIRKVLKEFNPPVSCLLFFLFFFFDHLFLFIGIIKLNDESC